MNPILIQRTKLFSYTYTLRVFIINAVSRKSFQLMGINCLYILQSLSQYCKYQNCRIILSMCLLDVKYRHFHRVLQEKIKICWLYIRTTVHWPMRAYLLFVYKHWQVISSRNVLLIETTDKYDRKICTLCCALGSALEFIYNNNYSR